MVGSVRRWLGALWRDRRGNVAMLFGLLLVPIVSLSGAAVDYSRSNELKSKLTTAADGAALLTVTPSGLLLRDADAQAKANEYLKATLEGVDATPGSLTYSTIVTKDSTGARSTTIKYSASISTMFLKIAGLEKLDLSGTVVAMGPSYSFMEMHVLLDNSPSMGIAATPADVARMEQLTGCGFACHDLSDPNNAYFTARKNNVPLRIDVLRDSIQKLIDKSIAEKKVDGQFRAALYSMGTSCTSLGLTTVAALSSDLVAVKTYANQVDLMTIPYQLYNDDQCSDYDAPLRSLAGRLPGSGDGRTASNPIRVVFIIGDGVQDYFNPTSCTQAIYGAGRCQQPITTALCSQLKAKGITLAVLYTTYVPLDNNGWYNDTIKPFMPKVPESMKACASSPDLYAEVTPTQGPEQALLKLFATILRQSRLVN